jgi:Sulfotransferase domain
MTMGRHVFVCGYSRSGTTMFYNMLRTTVTNFRFLEHESPARTVIAASPDAYVTKRPLDIFDVDKILAANALRKKVSCIILIRDLRSIVTSRHQSVPNDYFIGFDHQYFIKDGQATYTNPGILQIHRAIARTWQRRDLAKVILRYEDILKDMENIQRQLGAALGFEYQGSFADFHTHETPYRLERALNARRAPDAENIEAWRAPKHRPRIRDQFTRCPQLFDLLKRYGYETDDRWFDDYRDASPAAG